MVILPSLQNHILTSLAGLTVLYTCFFLVPLSIGIAILRHHLFDIDLLINRTLVYGTLTASVVGLYVLVVGGLGAVFQTGGNLLISLIATALVAVLFAPLRERLQRGANRLLYGERDNPYGVVVGLGHRLENTLIPEEVLPTIADSVARALKLPHVAIWLVDGEMLRLGAAYGRNPQQTALGDAGAVAVLCGAASELRPEDFDPAGPFGLTLAELGMAFILPLTHRGECIGALCLSPRAPGEAFSAADRRLLRDLASQAGAAAQAVQLTVALQASLQELRHSRERLIVAQEEERRRIQRDLHDGLGPVLASMRLRLEACLELTQSNLSLVEHLERLHELVGQATADIRRLVYDLRPSVLDQLGLIPAVQQHIERFSRETSLKVQFTPPTNLAIPAAAEVAIFRITHEALVNAQKHAQASQVVLRLSQQDEWLTLEIIDNGVGFVANGPGVSPGTGLGSMRERAELLGGKMNLCSQPGIGTELTVHIPVRR